MDISFPWTPGYICEHILGNASPQGYQKQSAGSKPSCFAAPHLLSYLPVPATSHGWPTLLVETNAFNAYISSSDEQPDRCEPMTFVLKFLAQMPMI